MRWTINRLRAQTIKLRNLNSPRTRTEEHAIVQLVKDYPHQVPLAARAGKHWCGFLIGRMMNIHGCVAPQAPEREHREKWGRDKQESDNRLRHAPAKPKDEKQQETGEDELEDLPGEVEAQCRKRLGAESLGLIERQHAKCRQAGHSQIMQRLNAALSKQTATKDQNTEYADIEDQREKEADVRGLIFEVMEERVLGEAENLSPDRKEAQIRSRKADYSKF